MNIIVVGSRRRVRSSAGLNGCGAARDQSATTTTTSNNNNNNNNKCKQTTIANNNTPLDAAASFNSIAQFLRFVAGNCCG